MTTVLLIHGGETFASRERYLGFLRGLVIDDPHLPKQLGWKDVLADRLGPEYDVLKPGMPNKLNASYEEWAIWFEKHLPYVADDCVLVGHSLGGIFLAKYLSESAFPKRIAKTILVAAPFEAGAGESLADFALPEDLSRFARQGGEITLFASEDDMVVPFADVKKYAAALPAAQVLEFSDRGHFLQEEFPELVGLIKG
jgi:predicted alpha/beta hydrolase family esterase